FFFQAEDGIRDFHVTGVQTCALPIYAPARDQIATAVRGQGAFLDGERLAAGSPDPSRDLRVATSHPDFTTDEQKRALLGLNTEGVAPRSCGSAGLEYLAIARGECDATAFCWEAAWDHAAGLLLVEEAGGAHLTRAGVPFRITGDNVLPFTTARDEATARRVVELLSAGVCDAGPGSQAAPAVRPPRPPGHPGRPPCPAARAAGCPAPGSAPTARRPRQVGRGRCRLC